MKLYVIGFGSGSRQGMTLEAETAKDTDKPASDPAEETAAVQGEAHNGNEA